MEIPEIIKALKRNMVETGSLICIGCGREHNCSTHGCAIMREAADALELLNLRTAPENKPIKEFKVGSIGYSVYPSKEEDPPLTLERLKNMHGEAVWIKEIGENHVECLQFDCFKPATYHMGDDVRFNQFGTNVGIIWWVCKYGKTWLPYANKPEGGSVC